MPDDSFHANVTVKKCIQEYYPLKYEIELWEKKCWNLDKSGIAPPSNMYNNHEMRDAGLTHFCV